MSTVTAVPLQPVKRGYLVWLWIGIALAVLLAVALAWAGDSGIGSTPSGLRYQLLKKGAEGPHPTDTDIALVQYEGRLPDGTVFDKSQQPTPMPVNGVVPGFSEGLKLMTKGAKYRLWIPPELGYGPEGKPPVIPPATTLDFTVELVDFLPAETVRRLQQQQQMMGGMPGMPGSPGGAAPSGPPPR